MIIQETTNVQRIFVSEIRPDVSTARPDLADAIRWADEHPAVWEIVTKRRSKAFGLGSCVYIGWAQKSLAPEAILERVRHFKELLIGHSPYHDDDSIFTWRARFTLEHYLDEGFRGGFFQQHDERYPRNCLTLDYTPKTLTLVLDKFCEWIGRSYNTRRITIDGKTAREF